MFTIIYIHVIITDNHNYDYCDILIITTGTQEDAYSFLGGGEFWWGQCLSGCSGVIEIDKGLPNGVKNVGHCGISFGYLFTKHRSYTAMDKYVVIVTRRWYNKNENKYVYKYNVVAFWLEPKSIYGANLGSRQPAEQFKWRWVPPIFIQSYP